MRLVALLMLAILLSACGGGDPGTTVPAASELVLRSYRVPAGLEERVAGLLRTLMLRGEERVGQAMTGPDGLVVVLAPEGLQEGVRRLITELESKDLDLGPAKPVEVTYWLVLARPPKGAGPADDPRLQEIRGALETVNTRQGPLRFELLERITASGLPGERSEVRGHLAEVRQRISTTGSAIVGDLEVQVQVRPRPAGISTRVTLEPGQFLILGESGMDGDGQLLYVIRTRLLEGA
jgi:hypothetical protein